VQAVSFDPSIAFGLVEPATLDGCPDEVASLVDGFQDSSSLASFDVLVQTPSRRPLQELSFPVLSFSPAFIHAYFSLTWA